MVIDGLISDLESSWNSGDGAGWAASFTEDAVFVDVLGRVQRGRTVIGGEAQKLFDSIYEGSILEIQELDRLGVADDLVVAHTTSTLRVPQGPRAGQTRAVQTTLVRAGMVMAFQNTIRAELAEFARDDQELGELGPVDWTPSE